MFAVGNPIVLPNCFPYTTFPLNLYGCPIRFSAINKLPFDNAFLIEVLLTLSPFLCISLKIDT